MTAARGDFSAEQGTTHNQTVPIRSHDIKNFFKVSQPLKLYLHIYTNMKTIHACLYKYLPTYVNRIAYYALRILTYQVLMWVFEV